jgi:hypothetical protein
MRGKRPREDDTRNRGVGRDDRFDKIEKYGCYILIL